MKIFKKIICYFKGHRIVTSMMAASPAEKWDCSLMDLYIITKKCSRCGKKWTAKYMAGIDPYLIKKLDFKEQ